MRSASPGSKFTRTNFTSGPQLSFAQARTQKVAALDGVQSAAAGLTLNAITVSGTVPESTSGGGGFGGPAGGGGWRQGAHRTA